MMVCEAEKIAGKAVVSVSSCGSLGSPAFVTELLPHRDICTFMCCKMGVNRSLIDRNFCDGSCNVLTVKMNYQSGRFVVMTRINPHFI